MPIDVPSWVSALPRCDGFGRVDGFRNAEIRNHRDAIREKYVLRLDVAMNHSATMRVIERTCDFRENLDGRGTVQSSATAEVCAQRLAGDERHHVVRLCVSDSRSDHRHDVRMLQLRGNPYLALEALG